MRKVLQDYIVWLECLLNIVEIILSQRILATGINERKFFCFNLNTNFLELIILITRNFETQLVETMTGRKIYEQTKVNFKDVSFNIYRSITRLYHNVATGT